MLGKLIDLSIIAAKFLTYLVSHRMYAITFIEG
jgi:hypothetical protein